MSLWILSLSLAFAAKPQPTRGIDVPLPSPQEVSPAGLGLGKYRAVLFSAQDYQDGTGIQDLATPNRDIEQLGAVLENQYGFTVTLVPDATETAIIGGLDTLKTEAGPDDAVIVYFAGHGLYDEVEKRGFWLPVDASLDNTSRWVSNDDVTAKLRAIPARHVLVIIDSCFSGMFRDVNPTWPVDQNQLASVQSLAGKRSRVVISSGSNEPVSDAGRDGMSVFAYYLRLGLEQAKDPFVLPDTLFPDLRQRVSQNSPQTPQQGVFHGAFHEGGALVFLNKSAQAQAAPTTKTEPMASAKAACEKESKAAADSTSRDAYSNLGVGGWKSPADQVAALAGLPTDPAMRQRMAYYTCMDYRAGQITEAEYQRWKQLLAGDPTERMRLAQEALVAQRRELREVAPPSGCEAKPTEAELLVQVNALLRDGTSQVDPAKARPEDSKARTLIEAAAKPGASAALWITVARARLYAGASEADVIAAADKAQAACPAWGAPESYRGSAYARSGKHAEARAAYQKAIAKSPDYAFVYYNVAGSELVAGEVDPAMGHLAQALKLDPTLGEAHFLRGRVLLARKQVQEAVVALESAVDLRPASPRMWGALAEAYTAAGDAQKAAEAKKRATP